jgi:hypothetical protein
MNIKQAEWLENWKEKFMPDLNLNAKVIKNGKINKMGKFKKGHIVTEEMRKKMSKSHTGKVGYWLGKTRPGLFSKETRKQMSESHKGVSTKHWCLSGALSHKWKGNLAGYRALHIWITNERGRPHFCEHCKRSDLSHRSYHWANISGSCKRELSDWLRLCAKCHKQYDKNK